MKPRNLRPKPDLRMSYLYLLINLFTISVPLIRSFEPRINYSGKFKPLFLAISITGAFFIIWDIIFTRMGIWGFNKDYLIGMNIFNLPIEECLFFITIPFACIFIYEVLNYFLKKDHFFEFRNHISLSLTILLIALAIFNFDKWYTFSTFILSAAFLIFLSMFEKVKWLGKFFRAYLVILIPFFVVNGILTGSGIENQVVWYNDNENLGIRIFTIPIEDTIYGMLLILMNTYFYEKFKIRFLPSDK